MTQVPPGSMGAPFVGEALKFLKDPFTFTVDRTRKHGNIWKTKILSDTVVFFAGPTAFSFFMNPENFTRENGSPKFLQAILDSDAVPFLDGDRHRARKRLLLSAFTAEALASYLPTVIAILERFVSKWTVEGPVVADLNQCAFDIANALFGGADPKISDVERAADFETMNKGAFSPPINLPFTAYGKALKARDRLRGYIREQIASGGGKSAGSALGILEAARGPAGEQLSPLELEIELIHFFVAAHAGLAAALAWMLVVLGEHPEIAAKLRTEADATLGDGAPTPTQVLGLVHGRAVAREVLRAYPIAPVTFLGVAKRDLEIEGFSIKAGWKGAGAIWATLQDGATFADPTVFRDDRLGDAALAGLPKNAYCPQGAGPADGHKCPGDVLIQMVMPAFLGWFTKRYDLTYPTQDVTPVGGGIGPLPKSGVRLAIKKRV